jgi:choline dehydrogenase-like flavoprotein
MLASEPGGIGNHHDLVGRHYSEHLECYAGRYVVVEDSRSTRLLRVYDTGSQRANESKRRAHLQMSPDWRRTHRTSNAGIMLLRREEAPPDAQAVASLGSALGSPLASRGRRNQVSQGVFKVVAEQTPNRDSRVSLAPDRDALGVPRIKVDWALAPEDYETLRKSAQAAASLFARNDKGTLRNELAETPVENWNITPSNHPSGTARMSADATQGVVDSNLRVHGLENLYVAGGAVFPTNGNANPTLTSVAMAIRLAGHLAAS